MTNKFLMSSIVALCSLAYTSSNRSSPDTIIETQYPARLEEIASHPAIVSIDFGNRSDQRTFVGHLKDKYPEYEVRIENPANYSLNCTERDSIVIKQKMKDHKKRLNDLVAGARFLHLSGHHQFGNEIIFSGDAISSPKKYTAGIDPSYFDYNGNVELIFLNACFSVRSYSYFTTTISKKFPNALLLGYSLRSAVGNVSQDVISKFLESTSEKDFSLYTQRELAELWINAGIQVYGNKAQERNLSAVWREGQNIHELTTLGLRLSKK